MATNARLKAIPIENRLRPISFTTSIATWILRKNRFVKRSHIWIHVSRDDFQRFREHIGKVPKVLCKR